MFRRPTTKRHFKRHFTLEEARAWLPELRSRLAAARAIYESLNDLRADYALMMQRIRSNGHAAKLPVLGEKGTALREALQGILDVGIQIKDLETGLVDFPHLMGSEEVFLCWRTDEEDIGYWHGLEDGFAGRQPIGDV